MTGKKKPLACQVTEQELPAKMRQFLADIDKGRTEAAGKLQSQRNNICLTLCYLIETARIKGLPEKLSSDTANAMLTRLKTEGFSASGIMSKKVHINHFVYATDEGLDWYLESCKNDTRPIDVVLRSSHWDLYRILVPIAIDQGTPNSLIRLADRWLHHRGKIAKLTLQHALIFRCPPATLNKLSQFMTQIDPASLDTRILQDAQRIRLLKSKQRPKKLPHQGLPEPFSSELVRISHKPADTNGISPSSTKNLAAAIRRLLRSARKHQLQPLLTHETAKAFVEDIYEAFCDGKLMPRSCVSLCEFLAMFVSHAGYPEEIAFELRNVSRYFKKLSQQSLTKADIDQAREPIDLVEVAKITNELLNNAPNVNHFRSRRRDYILAGVMALRCKVPLRTEDVHSLSIGTEICRDAYGWSISLDTSKKGVPIFGRLANCLTPYLDKVLLIDTCEDHLWEVYDQRIGTRLFGNPARDFQSYGHDWLHKNMVERTGRGSHPVRHLVADYCVASEDLDEKVAQTLLGHRSAASIQHYERNADRYRIDKAQSEMTKVEKGLNASMDKIAGPESSLPR